MSSAGFKRPGVECTNCKEGIPLPFQIAALNAPELATIPDQFLAKCPYCEAENLYRKGDIGLLVSVGS